MPTLNKTSLAIHGGTPIVSRAGQSWPIVGSWEEEAMLEVVRSRHWSWLGPHELAFTREWANFIGTEYAICLSNGTVTLQCALQGVGVEPGDEVIVPGFTWVATAQAALDIGANVVLVDIDPVTCCISPEAIRAAITPKTKAIIPVHLYGCMADMDAIMAIAREHDLKIVEDVAHQHGSSWRGTRAGAIGDVGSFSFQQSKILSSGEGGAVTCKDKEVYHCIHALKQVGQTPDPAQPVIMGEAPKLIPGNRYGHNYRITEMQCVLLRGGLTRLQEQNDRRRAAAQRLSDGFKQIDGPLQVVDPDERVTEQTYYALTMHYDPDKAEGVSKQIFQKALLAEGAPGGPVYPPVYSSGLLNLYDSTSPVPYRNQSQIQDYANLKLLNTERAVNETLMTFSHQVLLGDDQHIDQIIAAVAKVSGQLDSLHSLEQQ